MCNENKDARRNLLFFVLLTLGISGTSVNGGEVCYTDYYTLEYCEFGCCGEDVVDRHCCTKQPDVVMIIGCSVGGGILLVIIIVITILLCKYNNRTNPVGDTLSAVTEQTGDQTHRCDTSSHSHFPGLIHVTSGTHTKKIGINSHVVDGPCSCSEDGLSSGSGNSRNTPPLFLTRTTDRMNSYRTTYSPAIEDSIPEVITE